MSTEMATEALQRLKEVLSVTDEEYRIQLENYASRARWRAFWRKVFRWMK